MPELIEYLRTLTGRSLLIGVGNTLRGDDGFGPELVARLADIARCQLIDGAETPEDHLETIVSQSPDAVLIADAVAFGGRPGDAALLEPPQLGKRIAISTHTMPLAIFIQYLQEKLPGVKIAILGVQPRQIEFGKKISPEGAATIERLADILKR
jgi:hydrogenase 3 maturation protease